MHISAPLASEPIAHLGPLTITNSMVTSLFVIVLLCIVAYLGTRRMQVVPGRLQALLEMVVEFLLNLSTDTAGQKAGRKVFPLVATFFIFILAANWMGLLPGFGSIKVLSPEGHEYVPLLRAANSDLNMTAAMALISITTVQVLGVVYNGVLGYIKHLATPIFLLPVHILSEVSHIISLAARLFGNIFGGEVLMLVMYSLVPVLVPTVFAGLEALFGFIQALIFTVLSVVYMALAVGGEHGEAAEAQPSAAH